MNPGLDGTWHSNYGGVLPLHVSDNPTGARTSSYGGTCPIPYTRTLTNHPPSGPCYFTHLETRIYVRLVLLRV